jgi:alpha-glucosidase
VFPDWFGNNTQRWWQEGLQNWSDQGIAFSGIWLDMNGTSVIRTYKNELN